MHQYDGGAFVVSYGLSAGNCQNKKEQGNAGHYPWIGPSIIMLPPMPRLVPTVDIVGIIAVAKRFPVFAARINFEGVGVVLSGVVIDERMAPNIQRSVMDQITKYYPSRVDDGVACACQFGKPICFCRITSVFLLEG